MIRAFCDWCRAEVPVPTARPEGPRGQQTAAPSSVEVFLDGLDGNMGVRVAVQVAPSDGSRHICYRCRARALAAAAFRGHIVGPSWPYEDPAPGDEAAAAAPPEDPPDDPPDGAPEKPAVGE